jgi:hypothetical protein
MPSPSKNPHAIRDRSRRRGYATADEARILASVRKPIEDWDVDELAHGRPRDANGKFTGVSPKWITPAIEAEARSRLHRLAFGDLAAIVQEAVKVVADTIRSTETDENGRPVVSNRDRMDAAKFVVEHVIGKPKQRVDVEPGDSLKGLLAGALILPDGRPFIEGQSWNADGDEDEDEQP